MLASGDSCHSYLVTMETYQLLPTHTVNVEIFAQYIFLRISRRALDARKFDVSENYYHNRTNRINWYMRGNLAARMCLPMLDARKFSCAKICTFTVPMNRISCGHSY